MKAPCVCCIASKRKGLLCLTKNYANGFLSITAPHLDGADQVALCVGEAGDASVWDKKGFKERAKLTRKPKHETNPPKRTDSSHEQCDTSTSRHATVAKGGRIAVSQRHATTMWHQQKMALDLLVMWRCAPRLELEGALQLLVGRLRRRHVEHTDVAVRRPHHLSSRKRSEVPEGIGIIPSARGPSLHSMILRLQSPAQAAAPRCLQSPQGSSGCCTDRRQSRPQATHARGRQVADEHIPKPLA